ncbi:unnamed protein product [Prunus brigantina]
MGCNVMIRLSPVVLRGYLQQCVSQEGFAFAHCTTCKPPYHLRVHVIADRKWRTLKFRFFVTRDIIFIFLAVQLVIASLAYLVKRSQSRLWRIRLLGKDLTGLSLKELQQLEQQLNEGLLSVKERKEQLLVEQLEQSRVQLFVSSKNSVLYLRMKRCADRLRSFDVYFHKLTVQSHPIWNIIRWKKRNPL